MWDIIAIQEITKFTSTQITNVAAITYEAEVIIADNIGAIMKF